MHTKENAIALRPMTEADIPALQKMVMDPIITKTYMIPDYADPEAALPLCKRILELSHSQDHFVRGIYMNGQLVGFLNDTEMVDGTIELGYVIDSAFHGRGYMTQALKAAMEALFEKGFTQVKTGAFAENTASLRVMQKCGMTLLPYTDSIAYRGQTHLCIYYAKNKQE
jgi:RimJ/RimL family protein N-acetyltransferase